MNTLKLILAVILFSQAASCTSKTIYIDNSFRKSGNPDTYSERNCGNRDPCIFKIQSIEDDRRNKENLGRISGNLISGREITEWLRNGFMSIKGCGLTVISKDEGSASPSQIIHVSIQLKLAYAHTLSTSASTNLVLNITYKSKDHLIRNKTYRGTQTGLNWWSSETETKDSFNRALEKILEEVSGDMTKICEGKGF